MSKFLLIVLLVVGFGFTNNSYSNTSSLQMHVGEVRVLELLDVEQVAIGNDEVVLYRPSENGEFVVVGRSVGQSTLHVWQKGGRQKHYKVTVIAPDITNDFSFARRLVKNIAGVSVKKQDNKLVFLGSIDVSQKDGYTSVLANFPGAISLVKLKAFDVKPVIRVDVLLLEVKKRAVKELGIDWDDAVAGPIFGFKKTFTRNDFFDIARTGPNDSDEAGLGIAAMTPNDYGFYHYSGFTSVIGSIVNLLQESGDAEVIASPKLLAKSGESASFLSGGEYPVPIIVDNQLQVDFREYGVRLNITPSVDVDGNINTYLFTELSSIDFASAVNGVPGTISRKSETTINLKSGETYAISGLALAQQSNTTRKVPILGSIPLLGRLFRTDSKGSDSMELVIMVTPHIVTPSSDINQSLTNAAGVIGKKFKRFNWSTNMLE